MSICKECGGSVIWRDRQCFNADGSSHWDKCSERRWQQAKTGNPFADKTGEGFVHGGKRKYAHRAGITVVGKDYVARPDDGSLPWE